MKAFAKLDDDTVNCAHERTGLRPLHYCVAKGSKELLHMMLEGRADVNGTDGSGQTALMAAAKQGSVDLARALMDRGADPVAQDSLGRTAADMVKVAPAEDRPLRDWRQKLAGAGAPAPEDRAARGGELRELIDARGRPKQYGAQLVGAIAQRDYRTAEAALEAGGDVNMTDSKGDTPLVALARGKGKDLEAVQVRLAEKACEKGANVNVVNAQGNTALSYAAHRGSEALVQALLRLRADPAICNAEGSTALMYAAHGGHEAVCTALLEAFSPVSISNKHGLTAEETALKRGYGGCAALIKAYELAPKRPGDAIGGSTSSGSSSAQAVKMADKKKEKQSAFDYSKWNALEREMQQDEELEEVARLKDQQAAARRPVPKLEDLGPEAFGLPPDAPWPPTDPSFARKGPFDYSRWDKIVDDVEKRDRVQERYEQLQRKPQYEWRDGQKLQVIF